MKYRELRSGKYDRWTMTSQEKSDYNGHNKRDRQCMDDETMTQMCQRVGNHSYNGQEDNHFQEPETETCKYNKNGSKLST